MVIEWETFTMECNTLFTIAKLWNQPKWPKTDEFIKKCGVYTHCNTTQLLKVKILPSATVWMELKKIMLSKISQKDKDKYSMTSLICRIQRKITKKETKPKQILEVRIEIWVYWQEEIRPIGHAGGLWMPWCEDIWTCFPKSYT